MKKKMFFIGIDVSKATLDVFIYQSNYSFIVENNPKGFPELLGTVCKVAKCTVNDIFICFENTGKYSRMLSVFLQSNSISFVMEQALRIKKSQGITRGKNDKIDAKRIAHYAYEKREKLSPTILPGLKIDQIKTLLSLREKLIRHRTSYKNGLYDLYDCYIEGENNIVIETQKRLILSLNKEIDEIEKQILNIIQLDDRMFNNFKLLLTIKGVGQILAFYLIAFTANFTLFSNARSFSCFAGIAPFAYSSGIVIGKSRLHPFANKQLKSLLNLAAQSVIQIPGEYRQYYNRRVQIDGKSKMSTINIIRNKIVFRVFSVIQRQTPYVDLYKFAA
jgi:transposase